MNGVDILIIVLIVAAVGLALRYIIRAKRSGQKCIGCPSASACGKKQCNCNKQ